MTSRMPRTAVVVALAAAAALAYTLLSGGSADSAQQATSAAAESAVSRVSAFQRAAGPEDDVPGQTLLSGTIRRVGSPSSKQPVWGSVDASEVCVQVGRQGATACDTPERLEHEPLIVGSWQGAPQQLDAPGTTPPPAQEWAGLVENGVESIHVTYGDGSTETVPVVDNGFYVATEGRTVKTFGWSENGTVHTDGERS